MKKLMIGLLIASLAVGFLWGWTLLFRAGLRSLDERHHQMHHTVKGKIPYAYPHCDFCR